MFKKEPSHMMNKSKLELLGLQTLIPGLEMQAMETMENLRQARAAVYQLQGLPVPAHLLAPDHFDAEVVEPNKRRGRPPGKPIALLPAAASQDAVASDGAPVRMHRTKQNWILLREAGITSAKGGAPSREDVARAEAIIAGRRNGLHGGAVPGSSRSEKARSNIGGSVRARWALLKEAGVKPAGKGAPSIAQMEEARAIIAARKAQPSESKAPPRRTLTSDQKAMVGAATRDDWHRCKEANVSSNGRRPTREMVDEANMVLAKLCVDAGVKIKGSAPTLKEALKAKRILKQAASTP